MAQIQIMRMNIGDRRSVILACIANTIPKNRSQDIKVNVIILDTRDNTAKTKRGLVTHCTTFTSSYSCICVIHPMMHIFPCVTHVNHYMSINPMLLGSHLYLKIILYLSIKYIQQRSYRTVYLKSIWVALLELCTLIFSFVSSHLKSS